MAQCEYDLTVRQYPLMLCPLQDSHSIGSLVLNSYFAEHVLNIVLTDSSDEDKFDKMFSHTLDEGLSPTDEFKMTEFDAPSWR